MGGSLRRRAGAAEVASAALSRRGPCDTGRQVVDAERPKAGRNPPAGEVGGERNEERAMVEIETAEDVVTHVKIEYCPS